MPAAWGKRCWRIESSHPGTSVAFEDKLTNQEARFRQDEWNRIIRILTELDSRSKVPEHLKRQNATNSLLLPQVKGPAAQALMTVIKELKKQIARLESGSNLRAA